MPTRRLAAAAAACGLVVAAAPAPVGAAPSVRTVKLSGITFGGVKDLRTTLRAGDAVRFVWAGGRHDVVSGKRPAGVRQLRTAVTETRPPLVVRLTRPGTYVFV